MFHLCFICVIVLLLPFYTNAQDDFESEAIPTKCQSKKYMYRQCCLFPPFFNRDVARDCGAMIGLTFETVNNVTGFRRTLNSRCDHWKCILRKYELTLSEDDTKLDDERYFEHLDSWVELNSEFTNVMLRAKLECKHTFTSYMPMDVCQFYNFHMCIRNFINVNCPRVIPTEDCLEAQKFYEDCREYYQ